MIALNGQRRWADYDHCVQISKATHSTGAENLPEKWDPTIYRERAKAWREKAASLSENDPNRGHCVEIAEGYEKLADQLDRRRRPVRPPSGT
jgi:hypothetical protein